MNNQEYHAERRKILKPLLIEDLEKGMAGGVDYYQFIDYLEQRGFNEYVPKIIELHSKRTIWDPGACMYLFKPIQPALNEYIKEVITELKAQ